MSQPRSRSRRACSSVSMPSATTLTPSPWASETTARTMPTFGSWTSRSVTNERSILLVSRGGGGGGGGAGRLAGPEIVEDDPDAERAERLEDAEARLGAIHDARLGDLELEGARLEARRLEDLGDAARELRVGELAGREGGAHPEGPVR